MNKLDVSPHTFTLSPASPSDPNPGRRLIVLVSSLEADLTTATHRVWKLANATGSRVQFLGLYSDPMQEPRLRRELITMSAMVRDGRVSAEIDVIFGNDWVDVVKTHFQAGDTVVCFAEQREGPSCKPLSQILQSNLDVPLYILSDLYPRDDSHSNWPAQIAVWTGSIAIILGFFILQVKIDHFEKDWIHFALLLLTIPAEVWMIWVWNSLFG
ncbi:MAG TPA: hypothetical protein VFI68_11290 [Anaerolineales bacterium]|nr:hypothetical protein [Anaerolineales bacterium]